MKKRILATSLALMCAFTLLAAPARAFAPPENDSGISVQSETVRWYYRMNNGVLEMRLWSSRIKSGLLSGVFAQSSPRDTY